jgi:hypothetical protein
MLYATVLSATMSLIVGLFNQQTPSLTPANAQQGDIRSQTPPPPDQPEVFYNTGPMKLDPLFYQESRVRNLDPTRPAQADNRASLQFRLGGERLEKIVRVGNLILSEVVDDQGKSLIEADTYTEADKTGMRPMTLPAERIRTAGLTLPTRFPPPSRGAKTLKTIKGKLKLIYATSDTKQVTVDNPNQFQGKLIENPALKEMGIEVVLGSPESIEPSPPSGRTLVFEIKNNRNKIREIQLFDANMKQLRARPSDTKTKDGTPAIVLLGEPGAFNADIQVVFDCYPSIEEGEIDLNISDFELP